MDVLAVVNGAKDGWTNVMGLTYVSATETCVEATWTVGREHLQPFGLVHGGVHCGVIESVCSVGAAVSAGLRGHKGTVVGLENHTSFIRACGVGARLKATARPITRGRSTHLWEAVIEDEAGAVVATGRVRLLLVEAERVPRGAEAAAGSGQADGSAG
jgi:1,4-dihydroxy-2-naphthoyl-CoA hydrolase